MTSPPVGSVPNAIPGCSSISLARSPVVTHALTGSPPVAAIAVAAPAAGTGTIMLASVMAASTWVDPRPGRPNGRAIADTTAPQARAAGDTAMWQRPQTAALCVPTPDPS